MSAATKRRDTPSADLRIIGGVWRGRHIRFPARPGLRPTPNRVRETLFNWLQSMIAGSKCLDLFAGSGALGIEALSRGAGRVEFVESDLVAAQSLRDTLRSLKAKDATVQVTDAIGYLGRDPERFDIAFLDPPFGTHLLVAASERLARGWLKPGGLIYIEAPKQQTLELPSTWEIVRNKTAGQVGYYLARQNPV